MANDKKKDEGVPDEWFFDPDSVLALESLLKLDPNAGAIDSLENLGGAGIVRTPPPASNVVGNLPLAYEKSLGFREKIEDIEVDQGVIDKIAPALYIGAYELGKKIVGRDWRWPKGWSPKIRGAGKQLVAYNLALQASDLVGSYVDDWNKAHPGMKLKPLPGQIAAGVGAVGTYKFASKFAWTIMNNVKTGMAAEAMPAVLLEAKNKLTEKVVKQYGINQPEIIKRADKVGREATEKAAKDVANVVKERLGKDATKRWDDITRQLIKPRVATRVGKYLAKFAPKIATRLAVSATATVIPEGFSTFFGVLGIGWTAYDIFNLMESMPDSSTLYLNIKKMPPSIEKHHLIDCLPCFIV